MIIDWFTIIAQTFNFLVLVWLLKRFLYKPILNAIDAREKRIALTLKDAEDRKAEALQEKKDFTQKNEKFDQQREVLFKKARDKAEAEGREMLSNARLKADEYSVKRQEALQREQQSLHDEISRRMREEVFAVTRKTLTDLADLSLEERISEVFRRRLQETDDEKKKSLAGAFKSSQDPLLVRSAFQLPAAQQKKIQQALNKNISPDIKVNFETSPELISGIELTANGQKIAWSINEYLGSLEKSMSELMEQQEKPQNKQEEEAETDPRAQTDSGTSAASPEEDK